MFSHKALKNDAGIAVFSDYDSLRRAHTILHDVNERSPLIQDKEGFFLALAYDIRKAYEGQRLRQDADPACPESGTRLGFQILWPALLIQCRQFRDSLAFVDHTKEHQIVAYELEFVIEQAITAEFHENAPEIKAWWERLSARHPYLEENAETRVAQFAAWNKRERRNGLAGLLSSLDPMYPSLYAMSAKNGTPHLVSPEDYALWRKREFPEPDW